MTTHSGSVRSLSSRWLIAASVFAVVQISCGDDLPLPSPSPQNSDETEIDDQNSVDGLDDISTDDDDSTGTDPDAEVVANCADQTNPRTVTRLGEFFAFENLVNTTVEPCALVSLDGVAVEGMRLRARIRIDDEASGVTLHQFDRVPTDLELPGGTSTQSTRPINGIAQIEWEASHTGAYSIAIDSDSPVAVDFELMVVCLANCDQRMTRYPIVLVHGMGGTDAWLDLVEYFHQVPGTLRDAGYDVRITVVDPLTTSAIRAGQLAEQVDDILADSGAERVNLIGHSQGGIDCRALVSGLGYGDRVASITTIATPHHGTLLVDATEGLIDAISFAEDLLDAVGDIYGGLLGRGDQNLDQAIHQLGSVYMDGEFNPAHPDDPDVAYYSWAGVSCSRIDFDCRREHDDETIDLLLAASFQMLQIIGHESDGLVTVESATWGEFLGEISADHLDQVGQLLDEDNPSFNHLDFFLSEGERLFQSGF